MPYPAVVSRDAIIEKALELVEEGGAPPSLQQLAEALGIRAPSLYRYFSSRERLLAAAGLAGFRKLAAYIRTSTRKDPSLEAAALAIRRFAKKHPSLYRLMNETDAQYEDREEGARVVADVLAAAFGTDLDEKAMAALWIPLRAVRAYVHGFAMLELSGQFAGDPDDKAFTQGLDALLHPIEKLAIAKIRVRASR